MLELVQKGVKVLLPLDKYVVAETSVRLLTAIVYVVLPIAVAALLYYTVELSAQRHLRRAFK